jgi:hypothetical protein
MPTFKELAVIAKSGENTALARRLKAGDHAGDLMVSSWMAHQFMVGEAQRGGAKEVPDAEDGAVWYEWKGTLAGVLRSLQLISDAPAGTDKELTSDVTMRRRVGALLRDTGNALCLHRANGVNGRQPVWVVRAEFRELAPEPGTVKISGIRGRDGRIPSEAKMRPDAISASADEPLLCLHCGRSSYPTMLFRHLKTVHGFDPVPLLTEAIRQCHGGEVTSRTLADLIQDAVGGGIVSTNRINELLKPLADSPASPVTVTRGFSTYSYHWVEPSQSTASVQSTAPVPSTQSIAPVQSTAAMQLSTSVTRQSDIASQNGSIAPAVQATHHDNFGTVADALQRAEKAMADAHLALTDARQAVSDVLAENQELRGYRDRVKILLTEAGS